MDKKIRIKAEEKISTLLETANNAIALYNGLHGENGVFHTIASNKTERKFIAGLPIYNQAKKKLSQLRKVETERFKIDTDAVIEKKRQLSRINLIVPKSLHTILKEEAKEEGVSLSELVRLKMSEPYESILKIRVKKNVSL